MKIHVVPLVTELVYGLYRDHRVVGSQITPPSFALEVSFDKPNVRRLAYSLPRQLVHRWRPIKQRIAATWQFSEHDFGQEAWT